MAQKSEARRGRSKRRRHSAKVQIGRWPVERWMKIRVHSAGSIVEGDDGVRITERGRSRPQPDPFQACPYPQGRNPRETINGGIRRGSLGRYAAPTQPATGINVPNDRRRDRTALGGGLGAAGGGKRRRGKGANRPEACAKVQRLSQISEYGVQSTEGTG